MWDCFSSFSFFFFFFYKAMKYWLVEYWLLLRIGQQLRLRRDCYSCGLSPFDECPTHSCLTSVGVAQPVSLSHCRVGEGRAYWSLGNAHTALGNHEQAMFFAEKHLEIAKEVTVDCLPPISESAQLFSIKPHCHLVVIRWTAGNHYIGYLDVQN